MHSIPTVILFLPTHLYNMLIFYYFIHTITISLLKELIYATISYMLIYIFFAYIKKLGSEELLCLQF